MLRRKRHADSRQLNANLKKAKSELLNQLAQRSHNHVSQLSNKRRTSNLLIPHRLLLIINKIMPKELRQKTASILVKLLMKVSKSQLPIATANHLNQGQRLIQNQSQTFIQLNHYRHKIWKGRHFQALKRTKWIRVPQVLLKWFQITIVRILQRPLTMAARARTL